MAGVNTEVSEQPVRQVAKPSGEILNRRQFGVLALGAVAAIATIKNANAQGELTPLPRGTETPVPLQQKPPVRSVLEFQVPDSIKDKPISLEDVPAENREKVNQAGLFIHNFIAINSPQVQVKKRLGEPSKVFGANINIYDFQKNILSVKASLDAYYSETDKVSWEEVPKQAEKEALKVINRGNDDYMAEQSARVYEEFMGVTMEEDQGSFISGVLATPNYDPKSIKEDKKLVSSSILKSPNDDLASRIKQIHEDKFIKGFVQLKENSGQLLKEVRQLPPQKAEAAANILLAPLKYTLDLAVKAMAPRTMGFNEADLSALMKIGGNKINFALSAS